MIPISRIRSKTDMAIVLRTPMPPTMSAMTEKIQPASMIRRLEVSTLTTAPGSVTATAPGTCFSTSFATSAGRRPSVTVTPNVVTSPGLDAIDCTVVSGSTTRCRRSGCPSGRDRRRETAGPRPRPCRRWRGRALGHPCLRPGPPPPAGGDRRRSPAGARGTPRGRSRRRASTRDPAPPPTRR